VLMLNLVSVQQMPSLGQNHIEYRLHFIYGIFAEGANGGNA